MSKSAVDKAYLWLRERILDGSLPEGSFVDEATVCDAVGVSRTPAREAFNRLNGERFVVLVPRKGAQVRTINANDLYEAYHGRLMVESYAVTNFCSAKLAVPSVMVENLQLMDELLDFSVISNTIAYTEADRAFHTALVETLGNRSVIDFFDSLWRDSSRAAFGRVQKMRSEPWIARNRAQHHAIIASLQSYDSQKACEILREHLELPYSDVAG